MPALPNNTESRSNSRDNTVVPVEDTSSVSAIARVTSEVVEEQAAGFKAKLTAKVGNSPPVRLTTGGVRVWYAVLVLT